MCNLAPGDGVDASAGAVVHLDGRAIGLLGGLPGDADEQVYANVYWHHVCDAVPPGGNGDKHDEDDDDHDNDNDHVIENDYETIKLRIIVNTNLQWRVLIIPFPAAAIIPLGPIEDNYQIWIIPLRPLNR